MAYMMYNEAQKLLTVDINKLSLEELQAHKVKLLDAIRESKAEFGFEQAIMKGYYSVIESESADGFTPKDAWLSYNLQTILKNVEELEQKFYDEYC